MIIPEFVVIFITGIFIDTEMKKLALTLMTLALALSAFAQSPEEIVSKMDERMSSFDPEKDGFGMVMEMKMPILGSFAAQVLSRGDKTRMEMHKGDNHNISWSDEVTEWDYDVTKNEIEIKNVDKKKDEDKKKEGDVEMFKGITEGYKVSLVKETEKYWYLKCKKSKSNTDKDDPKTMNLVVEKGTFNPKSLSTKMRGVTVTMRDLIYGVSEEQVTFNPAKYPDAKIIDKR